MTERLIRAIENPHTSLIGHPTGRIQLRRDSYAFDMHAVLTAAASHKVAMELNSYPDRLDLNDVQLRQAKQHGVKIVIKVNTEVRSMKPGLKKSLEVNRRLIKQVVRMRKHATRTVDGMFESATTGYPVGFPHCGQVA